MLRVRALLLEYGFESDSHKTYFFTFWGHFGKNHFLEQNWRKITFWSKIWKKSQKMACWLFLNCRQIIFFSKIYFLICFKKFSSQFYFQKIFFSKIKFFFVLCNLRYAKIKQKFFQAFTFCHFFSLSITF